MLWIFRDVKPTRIQDISVDDIRFDCISQVLELRNFSSKVLADEVDSDRVVVTTRNNDVGDLGGRFNESIKSRLNESVVLVDDSLDFSSSFRDVSTNYSVSHKKLNIPLLYSLMSSSQLTKILRFISWTMF
jgi:hypothetical protein